MPSATSPHCHYQHIKLYIGPHSSTERNKNADPMDNKGAFLLLLVGLRRYSLGLSHTLLITWTRNCAAVAGINNKGVFCGRNFTLRIAYRIAEVALYAVASPEVFRPSMDFLPRLVRSRLKVICRCFAASMLFPSRNDDIQRIHCSVAHKVRDVLKLLA